MPPWLWPRAAYIHIPFCAHHCNYCDFAVVVGQESMIELYLDALAAELATLGTPQRVESIFIGGGTPTYLSAPQLARLLQNVTHWLSLSPDYEFTIESNPGTLDVEKVQVLAEHGVNRISLGVQSFHPHVLRQLERDHEPADVLRAVEAIQGRIPQLAFDLIFGVPGQSLHDWADDLKQALALGPVHLSTYGLTYEKGTPLWKQRWRGQLQPLHEEAELEQYLYTLDTLDAAGFEHYEISNHARPGKRSRHNQVYWANEAYFGFGLGAARYIHGRRELNRRDLQGYIRKALSGESAILQSEVLEPRERAKETMALQLRRAEGIERRRFREQTGLDLDALAGPALTQLVGMGLLDDDGASVRLTRRGKCVADAVIGKLL